MQNIFENTFESITEHLFNSYPNFTLLREDKSRILVGLKGGICYMLMAETGIDLGALGDPKLQSAVDKYISEAGVIGRTYSSDLLSITNRVIVPYDERFALHAGLGVSALRSVKDLHSFLKMVSENASEFRDFRLNVMDVYGK